MKGKQEPQEEEKTHDSLFVCGFCRHHHYGHAAIEFNFYEQKLFYSCIKCNKISVMNLSKDIQPPYPKTSIRK